MNQSILFDLHTHSISSGHGSNDTITDMVKAASQIGLKALGISEHGPATPGSATASYFRNLSIATHNRFNIQLLHGVELNILNSNGDVDLPEEILSRLNYCFISFHPPTCKPMSIEDNTLGYINAMSHSNVKFIGHMDDGRYPVNFEQVLETAKQKNIFPEINNVSLAVDSYRTNGYENSIKILNICRKINLPVLLSSDSHGKSQIANYTNIYPVLKATDFPVSLILNYQTDFLNQLCQ